MATLKSTDWFIDTFPSIVGLTADDPEEAEQESPGSHWSKQLEEECDGDEQLVRMCEKFCLVNKCKYSGGIASLVSPISGVLTHDSPRIYSLLLALGGFRDRFCLVSLQLDRSYSTMLRSAINQQIRLTENYDNITRNLLVSILRFHRPTTCAVIETLFGTNEYPRTVLGWLSSALTCVCDGAATARELLASIASTGEPAAVTLLATAALDEIVSSLPVSSAEAIQEALDAFSLSPDVLSKLWRIASEMAACTPWCFGSDFALFGTRSGRLKLREYKKIERSNDCILSVTPKSVAGDLLASLRARQQKESSDHSDSNTSMVFSIGEEADPMLSMTCIAGVSIETSLRPFVDMSHENSEEEKISRETTYIDARSEEERTRNDASVVIIESRPQSPRVSSQDWFADEPSSRTTDTTHGSKTGIVIHRLRNCVWMDSEMDLNDCEDEMVRIFLKKFEFFRGQKICVIGDSDRASQLVKMLLVREFPYVCRLQDGMVGLAQALAEREDASLDLISMIGITDQRPATVASKPSLRFSKLISSKEVMKLSGMFRRKKSEKSTPSQTPPPIVVAPSPSAVVVGRPAVPRIEFEIGGEEEDEFGTAVPPGSSSPIIEERGSDDDFSSVDLSPCENINSH